MRLLFPLLFLLLSAAASSSSASRTSRLLRLRKQLQDRAGLAHTHADNAFADALGQKDPAEAILAAAVPPTPKTTTSTTTTTIPTTTTTTESAVKTTTTTTDAPQKPVPAKPTKNLEKEDVPALEHTEEYLDHGVQGLHLGRSQHALNSKKRLPRNLGVGTSWAREGIGYVARSVASSVFAAAAATHQVGGGTQATQATQAMPTSSTTRHVKPLPPPGFSHAPAGLLLTKTAGST